MNFAMKMFGAATLGAVLALSSGAAFAKGSPTPQTHHCKLEDGTTDPKKTKKQCLAGRGTWSKDADAAAAPVAPAAAAAPAAPAASAAAPAAPK